MTLIALQNTDALQYKYSMIDYRSASKSELKQ